MSKSEMPAFNMIIESGRLVPSTAYDQERLDSFRRGTKVRVRFTEEKDRVLVRKWWAILSLVVKQCNVPWKTKEEASEAIKLALGIVNLTKTVKGDFLSYPKSLTDLEDPELQDAVDQMTELLSRIIGVDVETLKKEAARIVPDQPDDQIDPETGEILNPNPGEQSSPATPADDAPASALSPEPDRASSPDQGLNTEPADNPVAPAAAAGSASLLPEDTMSNADRALLMDCFSKLMAISKNDELDGPAKRRALATAKDEWKAALPTSLHQRLASIFYSIDGVIKGADRGKAITEYAYFFGCTTEELGA